MISFATERTVRMVEWLRIPKARLLLPLVPLLVSMAGCSESVFIATKPSGANVFVDGKMIGVSPVWYSVPKSDVGSKEERTVRIEKTGFEPVEDMLQTRLARGRAVGAFFTLGTLYLFRSPWYLLERENPYELRQSAAQDSQAERDRAVGERVRQLQDVEPNAPIVIPPPQYLPPKRATQ